MTNSLIFAVRSTAGTSAIYSLLPISRALAPPYKQKQVGGWAEIRNANVLGGVDAIRTVSRDFFAAAHSLGWRLSDVPRSQRTDSSAAAVRGHFIRGAHRDGVKTGIDFRGQALPARANRLGQRARPGRSVGF